MKKSGLQDVTEFIEASIQSFHKNRLESLESTSLLGLLKKKNPYLYRAKNLVTSQELVSSLLEAKLSSSEEEIFGEFLEGLALFMAQKRIGAVKSSAHGIDFEYTARRTRHLVAVKSGLNWGNSSQWTALHNYFNIAERILRQSQHITGVRRIIGICYGKAKTTVKKGAVQVSKKKVQLINKFTKEFVNEFCDGDGAVLWSKLVEFNSGNLTAKDKKELVKLGKD